jgi:hypothetical protein
MPTSPIYTQTYYNTTGDNAGVYVNPVTGAFGDSRDRCNVVMQLPCNFTPNLQYTNIIVEDSPCLFNYCTLISTLKSIAGSSLIEADATSSAITLTNPQTTAALANASLILNY